MMTQKELCIKPYGFLVEYLCSISVSVLDMYITGFPSCSSTAPNPCFEASHCMVCSDFASKHAKTGSELITLYSFQMLFGALDPISILCPSCKVYLMVVIALQGLECIILDSSPCPENSLGLSQSLLDSFSQ